jgi:hypothetical protein
MRRSLAVLATALALVVPFAAQPAAAHTVADYFPRRWKVDLRPDWSFTAGFPGGDWRSRVRDGVNQWNNRNQPLVWEERAQRADFNPDVCPATAGTNAIHWRDIPDDEAALAYTSSCTYGSDPSRVWSANIVFDSSRNWYTGTGDASDGFLNNACFLPPDCKWDAWSVASHEWGHASGFSGPFDEGHFSEGDAICPDSDARETMCPGIYIGTERQRTIEAHEIHTFEGAY